MEALIPRSADSQGRSVPLQGVTYPNSLYALKDTGTSFWSGSLSSVSHSCRGMNQIRMEHLVCAL
jgi:hypothetical protein